MDGTSDLAKRIRKYRERNGISQAALGKRVGRSGPMVGMIELGHRKIYAHEIPKWAKALGVDVNVLLGADTDHLYERGYEAGFEAAREEFKKRISDGDH